MKLQSVPYFLGYKVGVNCESKMNRKLFLHVLYRQMVAVPLHSPVSTQNHPNIFSFCLRQACPSLHSSVLPVSIGSLRNLIHPRYRLTEGRMLSLQSLYIAVQVPFFKCVVWGGVELSNSKLAWPTCFCYPPRFEKRWGSLPWLPPFETLRQSPR